MPKSKDRSTKGTKLEYTFKSDVLFKMLFVNHPDLLKRLVAVLLGIPLKSISKFVIINTEMPPEEIGKKFCRLDINMDVDGKKINLEIQVRDEGNYSERIMLHWARIYGASLPSGNNYAELPHTIIISIIDFELFEWAEVHSEFQVLEVKHHKALSDKQAYHFFELTKLGDIENLDLNSERDLWLALFNAETEEELEKLVSDGGEVMGQAVEAYRGITATDEFKNLEWLRRKTMNDEAQAIYNAELRGEHRGEERANERWQDVVADKDAELAKQAALIAELQARLEIKQ